jgi:nitronate monooxygenase
MVGFECVVHGGVEVVPTLVLMPAAANVISIPMIASGGFADARGLVAALALGCEGMNMGTRFMATREAPIHQNVKEAIVAADERSTALILRSMRNTSRVFGNSVAKRAIEMEREGKTIAEIGPIVTGQKGRVVYETGDLEHGIWSAGTSMGLIRDIPTCRELVEGIVSEAERLIADRLTRLLAPHASEARA